MSRTPLLPLVLTPQGPTCLGREFKKQAHDWPFPVCSFSSLSSRMSCSHILKVLVQHFLWNDLPQLNPKKYCHVLQWSLSSSSTVLQRRRGSRRKRMRRGEEKGGREAGREREWWDVQREREQERESLLSANSLLKILIPLKASKDCFFPLEWKKYSCIAKWKAWMNISSPTCHKPLVELPKEIPCKYKCCFYVRELHNVGHKKKFLHKSSICLIKWFVPVTVIIKLLNWNRIVQWRPESNLLD